MRNQLDGHLVRFVTKICYYETSMPISCCNIVALFGSYAIRVFPVGKILVDVGVWRYGVPILPGAKGMAGLYLWYFGSAVSAVL